MHCCGFTRNVRFTDLPKEIREAIYKFAEPDGWWKLRGYDRWNILAYTKDTRKELAYAASNCMENVRAVTNHKRKLFWAAIDDWQAYSRYHDGNALYQLLINGKSSL